MKKIATVCLLALSLTATAAFADFVPGRVRPVAVANMVVTEATGQFENVNKAMLYQNVEDGKGFVSLKLAIPGSKTVTLPIEQQKNTGCGDLAWTDSLSVGDAVVHSEFTDYSDAICLMHVENKWRLNVEMTDAYGNRSVLRLEGNPENLYLTL